MKTQFDKIYVLSLISNKDRQEFIKYQMNELDIDFEFIYGIDFFNLKYDRFGNEIIYPDLVKEWEAYLNNVNVYGCALAHYQAILQAYEFGYNNVLVLEDDCCFIKDKEILSYYLNNIPKRCDFITFTARFLWKDEFDKFNKLISLYNHNKKYDKKYIKLSNTYNSLVGGGMYGIMNRKIMELYLNNQRANLNVADHIKDIFECPSINRYTVFDAICIDQYNRIHYKNYNECYEQCYIQCNFIKEIDLFYKPNKYHITSLHRIIK